MFKYLDGIKNFFLNLGKMGVGKATGVILYLLSFPARYGVWFIAFYFVFVYNPDKPSLTFNMTIGLGVMASVWFLIVDRMKNSVRKTVAKPLKGVLPRIIYRGKYMFMLFFGYLAFTFTFEPHRLTLYLGICVGSWAFGTLLEGIKIKIFNEEWLD